VAGKDRTGMMLDGQRRGGGSQGPVDEIIAATHRFAVGVLTGGTSPARTRRGA
jgi:hypothetical protein